MLWNSSFDTIGSAYTILWHQQFTIHFNRQFKFFWISMYNTFGSEISIFLDQRLWYFWVGNFDNSGSVFVTLLEQQFRYFWVTFVILLEPLFRYSWISIYESFGSAVFGEKQGSARAASSILIITSSMNLFFVYLFIWNSSVAKFKKMENAQINTLVKHNVV